VITQGFSHKHATRFGAHTRRVEECQHNHLQALRYRLPASTTEDSSAPLVTLHQGNCCTTRKGRQVELISPDITISSSSSSTRHFWHSYLEVLPLYCTTRAPTTLRSERDSRNCDYSFREHITIIGNMDGEVAQFMSITGANEQVARGYLELSANDAMQAIQLFFEDPSLAANFNDAPTASAATASRGASQSSRRPTTGYAGRQDARGVIHIDSDDDINMVEDEDDDHDFGIPDDDDDEDNVAAVAQRAQEEEDAAMARRLQEEMYGGQSTGGGGSGPEDVRAPIAQRTEMLAAPDPSWDMADDRESAILEQLRRRQMARPRGAANPNPFSRSVWDDNSTPSAPASTRTDTPQTRAQRLADLFRPPYELISHLPWDQARDEGKDEKKWLLVNLQDMSDFMCQALNRDLWKDERIVSVVKEHFIFLQYDKNDPQADSYLTFYFPNQSHENTDNYPHVSVIDPRTGEQVKVWSGRPFPSTAEFHADLVEFLDRYSLAANSKNPVANTKPKAKPVDYGRMTEDEMLEMALKNSLEANGSGGSVEDPDSLTKSSQKGKGKEVDDLVDLTGDGAGPVETELTSKEPPVEDAAEEAAFAAISSTNPHAEPDNAPPQTTRIQFRHPSGRIIRRFHVSDEVRRIYEWLKAEPLEGKEGIVFELKAMPPGRDLIAELDKTIDEAGLKQGTVMIEFIED